MCEIENSQQPAQPPEIKEVAKVPDAVSQPLSRRNRWKKGESGNPRGPISFMKARGVVQGLLNEIDTKTGKTKFIEIIKRLMTSKNYKAKIWVLEFGFGKPVQQVISDGEVRINEHQEIVIKWPHQAQVESNCGVDTATGCVDVESVEVEKPQDDKSKELQG